jgi:hypothetical protein
MEASTADQTEQKKEREMDFISIHSIILSIISLLNFLESFN